jgi:chromosome segregation and condensation protein ScpB
LSPSALETLKQFITRVGIDEVRVIESSVVIDALLDRKLIKEVAVKKEVLGKPLIYGVQRRTF